MKVLLLELWGLGDAAIMTTVLRPLLASGAAITILCKPGTVELLKPTYPQVDYMTLKAPWTAFRGKYRLWQWPWRTLLGTIWKCLTARFDAAISVRRDPRDHLLMFLVGARHRIGFPRKGSGILLTRRLQVEWGREHRVDLWRQLVSAVLETSSSKNCLPDENTLAELKRAAPYLNAGAYHASEKGARIFKETKASEEQQPVVGLHCGAQIVVRRWDEGYYEKVFRLLRKEAEFHFALFPDLDGYGKSLASIADSCHEALSIPELVAELAACDLVVSNDSGPGHIAAALGRPVLAVFGPQLPQHFRPYGEKNHVVIRDICPFRPCSDYCHFSRPICLTDLRPDDVWPEIRHWFFQRLAEISPQRQSMNPAL